MFFGTLAVLIASVNFLSEAPARIREKLESTNETHGTFVQTKHLPNGTKFVSHGNFAIRPGRDFSWRTTEPFDALFFTTKSTYCYSNEDECVTKPLSELRGFNQLASVEAGDYSAFFKTFDALYREETNGVFHLLAKPKDEKLKNFLARIEADGVLTNWTLRATFPNQTQFEINFRDNAK